VLIINRLIVILFAFVAAAPVGNAPATLLAQEHPLREFTLTAQACSFSPARIEVAHGDRVQIVFVAKDAPHAFVIAAYRISKRATPERSVTFQFLADRAGTFPFFSDLTSDEGCADMRGELVVADRSR
jgi:heme/copper-type cytochrome/quinol oxidase subunit 2